MARLPRWTWLAIALAALPSGRAAAQDIPSITRDVVDIEGDTQRLIDEPVRRRDLRSPTHVEERLTDGELFYRLQDYVRASIIFTDIVDNYQTHRAFPDALFLLGDALFRAGDYLGARTRFRELIARAPEQAFRPYVQRALGRLIEIAIHTRDFDGVDGYFQILNQLPPSEIEATTRYFRAKYLYNRAVPTEDVLRQASGGPPPQIDLAMLDQARQEFEAVAEGSPYYPQARYFVGVIYTLREQYPQAIEAFRRVLRAPAETDEQREVVELTQLALGRLYYETNQLDQASEAYQAVPRTSTNFPTALYEIAWVYIRMGDSTRAERALEVLSVAAPDSRFIPDGKILRGNLLLRNGRFEDANRIFREVAREFGPVRRELDQILEDHADPQAYFRQLVRENMETFDAGSFLPPLAQRWAVLEGDMDRALSVLNDLATARRLVRETTELVERLNAVLGQPNRVAVFGDLRRQAERAAGLRNRVTRVRQQLLAAYEQRRPEASGELASVRAERRSLERGLAGLPVTDAEFEDFNAGVLGRYRHLERELARVEVELQGMDARIVATERYLETTQEQRDASGVAAIRAELAAQRQAVTDYRAQIHRLRIDLEAARIQVGPGDARYQQQARLREQYAQLAAREQVLLGASGEIAALFSRVDSVERRLDEKEALIARVVEERTADIRRQLTEETQRIVGYQQALAQLETETEDVVGGVTYVNFRQVQQRFYDLVLRADVGRIDVAWAEREEHRMRVEMLTRERAREMQALDDEFREIMDETTSAPEPASALDAADAQEAEPPSGTAPSGAAPSGAAPSGAAPSGSAPAGSPAEATP